MYCRRAWLAVLLLTGCGQRRPGTEIQSKTAVLRFENLSPNPADDWQGRALSELLKYRLGGSPIARATSGSPGISTERLAAIASGATRLIMGYYTIHGSSLSVTAFAEDPLTQKISSPVSSSGSLAAVAESLAKAFGAANGAALRTNAAALKEYALASDTPFAEAGPHYDLAIQFDPNFGPAYLGSVRAAVALNQLDRAQNILTTASTKAAAFSPEDRAYLQLESATVSRNSGARVEALRSLLTLNQRDPEVVQSLADAEMSTRQPAEAERHYRQLIALIPDDVNARNQLAYASLAAGDENSAREAAREYQRIRPQDPNAFDTMGDVELAFGHFEQAEKVYLSSPDLAFQEYSPTWKAAHARWMSGDAPGAETVFENHRKLLEAARNPIAEYRAAEWLFLTGKPAEAIHAMAGFAEHTARPELRAAAYTQAAIWSVLTGDRTLAVHLSDLALHPAQNATFVMAALARFLAQTPASPAEWRRRSELDFNGPSAVSVRQLALGLALLISNNMPEAVPVWKQIYETTGVSEPAPAYLYGWSLLMTGHKKEAAALLRLNPIPPTGVAPSFEGLYLPSLFEWRKSSLRQ